VTKTLLRRDARRFASMQHLASMESRPRPSLGCGIGSKEIIRAFCFKLTQTDFAEPLRLPRCCWSDEKSVQLQDGDSLYSAVKTTEFSRRTCAMNVKGHRKLVKVTVKLRCTGVIIAKLRGRPLISAHRNVDPGTSNTDLSCRL
jgi:hypothetical protein